MDVTERIGANGRTLGGTAVSVGKSVYSLVIVLLLWEAVTQMGMVHYYFLPPLSDVLATFYELTVSGDMIHHSYLTLKRAFAGLAIAIALGVPIGVLCARSRLVGWFFNPIIAVGYPVPIIALIPVFILWFGIGDMSKILLVALGTFWPIAVNARNSAEEVSESLIWSARMMGTSERSLVWKVIMPVSAPGILTGIQIGLPISLIITFIFEMVAGGGGLGHLEIEGVRGFDSPVTYAAIFAIMIIGFVLDRILRVVRARILSWT
ncbi:ABC transporter permease [Natrinema soli]|uniref:ABC transporter permease n=1 Tax=Natrinema soli TaxID=1930624 RepID=A0ABD5SNT2_9EURY|nr:ABC transporter permease [Natrinema soli]